MGDTMDKASLDNVELRARQAVIRDGITEVLLGAMLVACGAAFLIAPPFALLAVVLPFLLNWIGRRLKATYVYPRIGSAKAARRDRPVHGLATAAATCLVSLFAALGVFGWVQGVSAGSALWLSHFVPAFASGLMAIGPWTVARTYRLMRWYVCAALFVAGGIALPVAGLATGYDAISGRRR